MSKNDVDRYRIKPGQDVKLSKWPADETKLFDGTKEEGRAEVEKVAAQLDGLQELLFAQGKHKVLVIFQGMDTSGKDGALRHVFAAVDPQGLRVTSFKAPSAEDLAHDYLWRIHRHVPGKGELVVFNRSHYEDVLIVRVEEFVPKSVWSKRYDQINAFEKLLADSGTLILKFYLHISKDEQKERLEARMEDPAKRWKFNVGDLAVREKWDQYMEAYEDLLRKTSTKHAPWYLVPADRKWYRDYVIAHVLVKALKSLKMKYPEVDLKGVVVK